MATSLGDIIREYRAAHSMSMDTFSEKSGLSKAYISLLEKNRHPKTGKQIAPSVQSIKQAAIGMNMDFDVLFDRLDGKVALDSDRLVSHAKGVTINVLGRVAAGIPIEAMEDIIDTEEITEGMACTGEFFGLQIHGDSMEPQICNGDIVIVRQQDDAESGEVVVAMINGNDATCKRLMKYPGGISLISFNNAKYDPMMFSDKDIIDKPVRIIGKVVELRRKF